LVTAADAVGLASDAAALLSAAETRRAHDDGAEVVKVSAEPIESDTMKGLLLVLDVGRSASEGLSSELPNNVVRSLVALKTDRAGSAVPIVVALVFALLLPLSVFLVFRLWPYVIEGDDMHRHGPPSAGACQPAPAASSGSPASSGPASANSDSARSPCDASRMRLGAIVLLIYVALLATSDVLANATAQRHGGTYPWDPLLVVLAVEVGKSMVSGVLFLAESAKVPRASMKLLGECALRLLPVAMAYGGNNYLVLHVLSQMHLDSFVVWRNSSIVFNAFFWRTYFGRPLTRYQLIGVAALLIGCCLSTITVDGTWVQFGWPVFLVLLSALVSSLGAIANEAVLKTPHIQSAIGVNRINMLLYSQASLLVCIAYMCVNGPLTSNSFKGFDFSACIIVAMSVVLGLVVSRVLFYTDAVAKVMAGGAREIVTISVAPLFTVSRCDWISITAALWVFFAVTIYFAPMKMASGIGGPKRES